MHPVNLGMAFPGGDPRLAPGVSVLAEPFLSAGYTTCTLDNMRRRWHWFGNGSEFYIDPGVRHPGVGHGCAPSAGEINARAIPWLRIHRDEPFFVCIRYSQPFLAGEQLANGKYDLYLRAVDDQVGQLLTALDHLRLSETTLVALAGGCGWSLGEHGIWGEGGLYDCANHAPLLMRLPGRIPSGTLFDGAVQTQDLAPTLLEAASLNVPANLDGCSFWRALLGEAPWRERESLYSIDCKAEPQRWSLRKGGFKLILTLSPDGEARERWLYRLADDPGEQSDVAGPELAAADSLTAELQTWIAQRREDWARMEEFLVEL
jgi:arylsulfatase A-like enzyme